VPRVVVRGKQKDVWRIAGQKRDEMDQLEGLVDTRLDSRAHALRPSGRRHADRSSRGRRGAPRRDCRRRGRDLGEAPRRPHPGRRSRQALRVQVAGRPTTLGRTTTGKATTGRTTGKTASRLRCLPSPSTPPPQPSSGNHPSFCPAQRSPIRTATFTRKVRMAQIFHSFVSFCSPEGNREIFSPVFDRC